MSKDTANVRLEGSNVSKDDGNVSKDDGNVSKDAANVSKDDDNVRQEGCNVNLLKKNCRDRLGLLGAVLIFVAKETGCGRTQKNLGRTGDGWDGLGLKTGW
ncbi:MAG: hypothetical protein IT258_13075 [Saprospiraceae bacterium]|nr:hypothetical protein [Saprospiraceae bacterium]